MRPAAIRLFPDPVLRQKAAPVKSFDASLLRLIHLLDATLRKQTHGIGIAAPQIGMGTSLALVDVSSRVEGAERLILINPVIVEVQQERVSREGCMSLPDYTAQVKRYNWVRVVWKDEMGRSREKISVGIEAVCVQHEVDHLNGILFLDRVVSLKRDMIPRPRLRKSRS